MIDFKAYIRFWESWITFTIFFKILVGIRENIQSLMIKILVIIHVKEIFWRSSFRDMLYIFS